MKYSEFRLGWRSAVVWCGIVIFLCFLGTYFAYNGPLSSDLWRHWSGPGAWKRDVLRVLVWIILSLFLLLNSRILVSSPVSWKKSLAFFRELKLTRNERAFLLVVIVLLLLFQFLFLPRSFVGNQPITFGHVLKPYIPYFFYTSGLWIGILFPMFVLLIRLVPQDWNKLRDSASKLDLKPPLDSLGRIEQISNAHRDLLIAFQDHVAVIKDLTQRYIPIFLTISLYMLYEQTTPSYETLTPLSVEAGKVALWLFLGPVLIVSLIAVAAEYQSAARKAEVGLRSLIGASIKFSNQPDTLLPLLKARDDLLWDRTPGELLLSIAKSPTLSIPLLFALTAYVLNTVHGPDGWVGIFMPKVVINFFRHLFSS
jgi:hypothetical protein